MKVGVRVAMLLFAGLVGLAGCGEPEDTRPGRPVAHRQKAFKDIFEVFDPMGAMLKKETLDGRTLQILARQLAERKNGPWDYFGADSQYPPSHAKDTVWSESARFERYKKDFLAASDALTAAAAGQDRARIEAAFGAVRDSCETCHKAFKNNLR